MSKVKQEKKKGSLKIINILSYPEAVNKRMLHAITVGELEGILPIVVTQKKKDIQLECEVQEYQSLKQYLRGNVTRRGFLLIASKIASLIQNCEKKLVSPNDLELQLDRIFIDPKTLQIKCIYWPIVNNQRDVSPIAFFKGLTSELKFSSNEDRGYLQEYKAFFKENNLFSINDFLRMLRRLSGEAEFVEISPDDSVKNKEKTSTESMEGSIAYDPFGGLAQEPQPEQSSTENAACPNCGYLNKTGSKFCANCGTLLPEIPIPQPAVQEEIEDLDDEGTTGYHFVDTPMPVYVLKRVSTGESFLVDKPIFRIGRKKDVNDLCIQGNEHVSGKHGEILVRKGRFFLVDKESTNKTYLNGEVLEPGVEVELLPGANIVFANEEFIFQEQKSE